MTISLSRVTSYIGGEDTYFMHVYNHNDPRESDGDEDGKSANHACLIITKEQYYQVYSELYWD